MNTDSTQQYDVIVIGSGIGGLSVASLLAQLEGKSVLVLERHYTAGGYTHAFSRKNKYEWDVGVHYVGEMYQGSHYRRFFDLITNNTVKWHALPEIFDRFIFPDFEFAARAGFRNYAADLKASFPQETDVIDLYLNDLIKAARWFGRLMLTKLLPHSLKSVGRLLCRSGANLALMSTDDYLNQHIKNPKLKAVLTAQWGDIGLPPQQSAFCAHALVVSHYYGGGYYPVGGAKSIAAAVSKILKQYGGEIKTRRKAKKIIVENNTAIGVEVSYRHKGEDHHESYFADLIISAVGAPITYCELLDLEQFHKIRQTLQNFPRGSAHTCLYIGFKESPEKLGFKGENLWIYDSYDHDADYARLNEITQGKINSCFLSFPSLKNPQANAHTAELICFADYASFENWQNQSWGKRGKEYDAVKQNIAEGLLRFVEKHFPGFTDLVEYTELSTPLSTQTFTGHHQGAIYGLPAVAEKFTSNWLDPRTPVKNLYLTGSDIAGHGIVGAMMGGIISTLVVSNKRFVLIKNFLLGRFKIASK